MTDKPRRVLLIVVDGGCYNFLEKYDMPHTKELIERGVSFRNAVAGHSFIETASGMATISTGADIGVHGIIASHEWYDSETGESVYSVDEYGRAVGLKAPTFGDVVKDAHPGAVISSLSSKDRPAVLLAGHSPDTILYSYRERPGASDDRVFTGAGVTEEKYLLSERLEHEVPEYVKDLSLPRYVDWVGDGFSFLGIDAAKTPRIDDFIADAALKLMKHQRPDVMCVGLVSTNIVGHYQPLDSPQMEDSARVVDNHIGRLVAGLRETGMEEETLIAITADHAMTKIRCRVDIPRELRAMGRQDLEENIAYIVVGGTGGIYLKSNEKGDVDSIIEALSTIDNVRGAWHKRDPEAPWFIKNVVCDHGPDIILLPEFGGYFVAGHEQRAHMDDLMNQHGSPYNSDANIMMILSGPGVEHLGSVGNPLDLSSEVPIGEEEASILPRQRDLAPTILGLLGMKLPGTVCGKPLPVHDQ
jgi:predicted AlkP superfamily pyrophosphatase or phosphodiesterase